MSLALAPLRCQDPIRERVNSQTDYPGVNSDVYENPIQIYANYEALDRPTTRLRSLHLLCYYRNLQGATDKGGYFNAHIDQHSKCSCGNLSLKAI